VKLIITERVVSHIQVVHSINHQNTLKGVSKIMSSEITILGNLGADAELRYMPNGDPVTSFSICSNERSGSGENRRETQDWYNVSLFGNSAEKIAEHLTKGTPLFVRGRLKPVMWEGRDKKTRLTLNVYTNRVEFTGGKRSASPAAAPAEITEAPAPDLSDEDIPF
jgi:single-strand DNA-binding protein